MIGEAEKGRIAGVRRRTERPGRRGAERPRTSKVHPGPVAGGGFDVECCVDGFGSFSHAEQAVVILLGEGVPVVGGREAVSVVPNV